MVHAASTTDSSTRNIIRNAASSLDEFAVSAMPGRRTIARRIQRARRRVNPTPPVPTQRSGFAIPQKYTESDDLKLFLQFDSGVDDDKRILLFSTDDNLDLMTAKLHWFADGTFKCAPEVYYQVFSIHVYISGTVVPVLYALLPDKTEHTYLRMLQKFAELRNFTPQTIVTDFEIAQIKAFKQVFPNAEYTGCFYHFLNAYTVLYSRISCRLTTAIQIFHCLFVCWLLSLSFLLPMSLHVSMF